MLNSDGVTTETGIAHLFDAKNTFESGAHLETKFYVSGIGTTLITTSESGVMLGQTGNVIDPVNDLELIHDDNASIDGAAGLSMQDRVNVAVNFIKELQAQHPGAEITIDVAGFSRGGHQQPHSQFQDSYQASEHVTVGEIGHYQASHDDIHE